MFHSDPFVLRHGSFLFVLVGFLYAFVLYQISDIYLIPQDSVNGLKTPSRGLPFFYVCIAVMQFLHFLFVFGWNQYPLIRKDHADFCLSDSAQIQVKNTFYHFCRIGIRDQMMVIFRILHVSIRCCRAKKLPHFLLDHIACPDGL